MKVIIKWVWIPSAQMYIMYPFIREDHESS